jgi:hypothetical protein
MALNNLSYGWTPGSVLQASGWFGGSSAGLPNGGATLATNLGLNRTYPSWLNQYGYQGSLNTYQDPTVAAGAVDPFMQQVADAQAKTAAGPSTGDTTASPQQPATFDPRTMGGEMNAAGGQGNGEFPNSANAGAFGRGFVDAATGFPGALGRGISNAFDGGSGMASGAALDSLNAEAAANTAGGAPGLFHGGLVTPNKLGGPDPDGPDDGYAALNVGEGVLTRHALAYYGPGIISRLNKLAVPKDRLAGK